MSERHTLRQFDNVAQKWRDLAERRHAYFIELYRSGRWRHYYSEDELLMHVREAAQTAENWAKIAPRPKDKEPAPVPQTAAPVRLRRTA